jgi:hypothetical protein
VCVGLSCLTNITLVLINNMHFYFPRSFNYGEQWSEGVTWVFFNCNIVKSHRLDFEHHFSDVFPASHWSRDFEWFWLGMHIIIGDNDESCSKYGPSRANCFKNMYCEQVCFAQPPMKHVYWFFGSDVFVCWWVPWPVLQFRTVNCTNVMCNTWIWFASLGCGRTCWSWLSITVAWYFTRAGRLRARINCAMQF